MVHLKIPTILLLPMLSSFVIQIHGYLSDSLYVPQVRPSSTEDVVDIVNIARKYRVPIVAYSGATSLEGHFSGVRRSQKFNDS
jgi:hypothetical protein